MRRGQTAFVGVSPWPLLPAHLPPATRYSSCSSWLTACKCFRWNKFFLRMCCTAVWFLCWCFPSALTAFMRVNCIPRESRGREEKEESNSMCAVRVWVQVYTWGLQCVLLQGCLLLFLLLALWNEYWTAQGSEGRSGVCLPPAASVRSAFSPYPERREWWFVFSPYFVKREHLGQFDPPAYFSLTHSSEKEKDP